LKPISGRLLGVFMMILPINLFGQCTANTFSPSVTICTPAGGATVGSPVHVQALTTAVSSPVKQMMVYVDDSLVYQVAAAKLDTYLSASAGGHQIKVQAQDGWNRLFYATATVSVGTTILTGSVTGAPTIATLSQTSGIPGNHVTVTGTNFVSGATVRFGGVASSSVVVSSVTRLVAKVPAREPGTVDVQVVNPDGQEATKYSSYRIGQVLLKDGFDAGSFASWTTKWDGIDTLINANKTYVHSGNYSAQIHYHICATCGAAHQDSNRWFRKDFTATNGFPNGLNHVFVKGYMYIKSPEPGGALNGVQRKLYYFKSPNTTCGAASPFDWGLVLTSDGANGQIGIYLAYAHNCTQSSVALYGGSNELGNKIGITDGIAALPLNQFLPIEMEVKANEPGVANGELRVWLNGVLVFQKTGLTLRDAIYGTEGIKYIELGRQVDRVNYTTVDEYRYWDDIVIADAYIE
jgi:IPT/TIG domain/Bacterial Ig domain